MKAIISKPTLKNRGLTAIVDGLKPTDFILRGPLKIEYSWTSPKNWLYSDVGGRRSFTSTGGLVSSSLLVVSNTSLFYEGVGPKPVSLHFTRLASIYFMILNRLVSIRIRRLYFSATSFQFQAKAQSHGPWVYMPNLILFICCFKC